MLNKQLDPGIWRCRFCEWYSGSSYARCEHLCELAYSTNGPEQPACESWRSGGVLPEIAVEARE